MLVLAVVPAGNALALHEHELANTTPRPEFQRYGVSVEQFEGDCAIEPGIDESGVVDEQPAAPDAGTTLDKPRQGVGKPHTLHRPGEKKAMCGDDHSIRDELNHRNFPERATTPVGEVRHKEVRAKAKIHRRGLDGLGIQRRHLQVSGIEGLSNRRLRENHAAFFLMVLRTSLRSSAPERVPSMILDKSPRLCVRHEKKASSMVPGATR